MAVAQKIAIVCLVTRVCLTSAILTAKVSSDTTQPTNTARLRQSYLPVASAQLPKHPRYAVHPIGDDAVERPVGISQTEYSKALQSVLFLNNHKQQPRTGPQRFPTEIHNDDVWLSAEVSNASPSPPSTTTRTMSTTTRKTTTTTMTTLSGPRDVREYQRHVPRRFVYQDIGQLDDGYLDDEYLGKLPYRGKAELTYHRRGPQDITTAIKTLDRFLSGALNSDSYNSALHPPPNPILALVLSRYGRYVPGTRNPRLYAHMAVNNVHNNKPFGRYKYEYDDEPIYAVR